MPKRLTNKAQSALDRPSKKIAKAPKGKKTAKANKNAPAASKAGGEVKEWVQRLRDVGCKVDVPINIMLEWDSGSDLDLWAKCMCTDRDNWIGYSNMKCQKCQIELDHDIMTGTDGRKPTPLEHIYFNKPELCHNRKIEFYVHNYNDNTRRATN